VIAATKVLTAAHCVKGIKPTRLTVVANRAKVYYRAAGEEIKASTARAHPDYSFTRRHDLAVITLSEPTTAPPLALPTVAESRAAVVTGRQLRVAGWGAREPTGLRLARFLKHTTERVRTAARCRRAYGKRAFVAKSMICALGKRFRRYKRIPIHSSACSGDSGGPLVADTALGARLVGVVSYGGPLCGLARSPTVYARVADGLDFINAALAP